VLPSVHVMGRYSNQGLAHEILDRCLALAAAKPVNRAPRPAPRRLKDKLSDSDRAAIVAAYVAGTASIAALAERHGVSDYSVRLVLRNADIGPKRSKATTEQTQRVEELWRLGRSMDSIAAEMDMGPGVVRLIVARTPR
jgi:transposase-like protein